MVTKEIHRIYKEHKRRIGSIKMKKELDGCGIKAGKNRVASIMSNNGLRAKTHRKFRVVTTNSKHNLPVADNLLNRNFTVSEPNKVLVSDYHLY
ncbi:IS3 family transposase [Chitinispirillales bacterium ANBcel5]|uniref:IS3 family transposase n=1 Tax=Cellulosispirillum alkaliphilum TaxID=3039283 RepID=UPI002A521432|nr:IS3 family transposase [Chitinispirillales bacterium ANBcel5]